MIGRCTLPGYFRNRDLVFKQKNTNTLLSQNVTHLNKIMLVNVVLSEEIDFFVTQKDFIISSSVENTA